MKIAVTADVHLTAGSDHPERYNALSNILDNLVKQGINTLVIAGDLFDKECFTYIRFEDLCRQYSQIEFHIIPGNHDPDISSRSITGRNISIYDSPGLNEFDGLQFMFVPFRDTSGMGEFLEETVEYKRWVLVGHGDYSGGMKQQNPYEKGTYMPLYRKDIEKFSPWRVFLGHIHMPVDNERLYYPGSPCGIDINETGRRRYIVFDTSSGHVTSENVQTDVLFFNEKFLVIPGDNELERLRKNAEERISGWGLEKEDTGKAVIRIKAAGYASDRSAVMRCLMEVFEKYSFLNREAPDISQLYIAEDNRRNTIARRVLQLIDELDWELGGDEPQKEMVIEAALMSVYGGGGS